MWHQLKDAVWDWFVFWGPVARDFLSVGLAALGAFLAYLAIKLGKEQSKIAKRQTEIAETQHEIMLEQQARKAALKVETGTFHPDGEWRYAELHAVNLGNGTARGFYWELHVPNSYPQDVLYFREIDGGIIAPVNIVSGSNNWRLIGDTSQHVFPRRKPIPFSSASFRRLGLLGQRST